MEPHRVVITYIYFTLLVPPVTQLKFYLAQSNDPINEGNSLFNSYSSCFLFALNIAYNGTPQELFQHCSRARLCVLCVHTSTPLLIIFAQKVSYSFSTVMIKRKEYSSSVIIFTFEKKGELAVRLKSSSIIGFSIQIAF